MKEIMKEIKFCRDCMHATKQGDGLTLLCMQPRVTLSDEFALSRVTPIGVSATVERQSNRDGWKIRPCGRRGALWEEKLVQIAI